MSMFRCSNPRASRCVGCGGNVCYGGGVTWVDHEGCMCGVGCEGGIGFRGGMSCWGHKAYVDRVS